MAGLTSMRHSHGALTKLGNWSTRYAERGREEVDRSTELWPQAAMDVKPGEPVELSQISLALFPVFWRRRHPAVEYMY